MLIKNAKLQSGIADIKVEDGKIVAIGSFEGEGIDAGGKLVIPGLIDTHIHGYGGIDASDSRLDELSIALAKSGTTAFLPTAMTDSPENLKRLTNEETAVSGAQFLGFHLEGPYISHEKKGAQNEAYIKSPDMAEFGTFGNVAKITVAPEVEGAIDFIKNSDCKVSIGHTACDYEVAIDAIEAGADCLTHTFNAMPPILHRAPGPIGAAAEKGIYAELICDGRHVHKAAVLLLYKVFGPSRLMLISDCIRPAGLPDGEYSSGGLKVIAKSGTLTLTDGTLAGGSTSLLGCVKTAVNMGIPFYDAVRMASATPAEHLGIKKGKIEVGFDADLVILDDDMNPETVIINGKIFE